MGSGKDDVTINVNGRDCHILLYFGIVKKSVCAD